MQPLLLVLLHQLLHLMGHTLQENALDPRQRRHSSSSESHFDKDSNDSGVSTYYKNRKVLHVTVVCVSVLSRCVLLLLLHVPLLGAA